MFLRTLERICGAAQMRLLRDDREVFNVPQLHLDNRNS